MIADKAYEFFNHELNQANTGLQIRTPETVRDVSKSEIPLWVKSMGGHAVIKIPYSNAGQGVYTITNQAELDAFMAEEHHYDKFIVQSLVARTEQHSTAQHSTTSESSAQRPWLQPQHSTIYHSALLAAWLMPMCSTAALCVPGSIGGQCKLGHRLSQSSSPLPRR